MKTKTYPQDLASLRAARLPLLRKRDQLEADVFGRDEGRAAAADYLRNVAAEQEQNIRTRLQTGDAAAAMTMRAGPGGVVNLAPMLAAIFGPEAITAALDRHFDALPVSIDAETRAGMLADIGAELDTLEDAEEIEVCRLEALGERPDRRGDARPAIVLKVRG